MPDCSILLSNNLWCDVINCTLYNNLIIIIIIIIIIIVIIIIFIEDINFTYKWFTKESSKIKKEQKGKIKTNIWIYKN